MLTHLALLAILHAPPTPAEPRGRLVCGLDVVADPAAAQPEPNAVEAGATDLHLEAQVLPGGPAHVGVPVALRLSLVNRALVPVIVHSGNDLRAEVADARGVYVWQHPPAEVDGTMVVTAGVGCLQTVLPGHPLVLGRTWDLTDAKGQPLPPGEYVVHLAVDLRPQVAPPPPFRLTILPAPDARTPR